METVLAVDPGREKCGVAVVTSEAVLFRAVVPTAEIGLTCRYLLAQHKGVPVVVGDATCSARVQQAVRECCPAAAVTVVPERGSSLEARRLYFQEYPARGWQRLVPEGMRVPPRPVDDYAAVVLARAYFAKSRPPLP